MRPLLDVTGLSKRFTAKRDIFGRAIEHVTAVDDVSFSVGRGETLGLVGESGSGKSTTGRLVSRLIEPDAGRVLLDGTDLLTLRRSDLRAVRSKIQMIFQDPFSSLDPTWTIGQAVTEGQRSLEGLKGAQRAERAVELLELVGLSPDHARRYPHEFSGGQRQRIAIARALALEPDLVVCDEAVSALDVSTQAAVLSVLESLRERLSLSYLFISHDLSVVRHVSDRIAVMYLGRIVESGPAAQVYDDPRHPYSQALLSAVPQISRSSTRAERIRPIGDLPSPLDPPSGCTFHPRCPHAFDRCRKEVPTNRILDPGDRGVACHLYDSSVPVGPIASLGAQRTGAPADDGRTQGG